MSSFAVLSITLIRLRHKNNFDLIEENNRNLKKIYFTT